MQKPKLLYLFALIIVIILAVYLLFADTSLYFPAESSVLSKVSSSSPVSLTTGSGIEQTGKMPFAALFEGLTMKVTNENGDLSIEARKGWDRCYTMVALSECLTLQTTTADQPGQSFFSGKVSSTATAWALEAAEGSLNFDTIKDAIAWIDNEKNRPFNFIYDDRGLAAGWHVLKSAQGLGNIIQVQVWQIYIDGEKPERLPGSDRKKMSFSRRAVEISAASPMPQVPKPTVPNIPTKNRPDPALLEKMGQEYCVSRQSEEFGEQSEINSEKEGVSVPFLPGKNEQIVSALGASFLEPVVERWVEEKDRINGSNKRPVIDRKKIHVSFDQEAYFVPDDIGNWIRTRKHFVVTGKWFKYKDVDYLYLSAGLDPGAFLQDERTVDAPLYTTELVYQFVNGRYAEVALGQKVNSLRIENDLLVIGTGTYGYEGAHGKIIAFDGNREYEVCGWGSGI